MTDESQVFFRLLLRGLGDDSEADFRRIVIGNRKGAVAHAGRPAHQREMHVAHHGAEVSIEVFDLDERKMNESELDKEIVARILRLFPIAICQTQYPISQTLIALLNDCL